MNRQCLSLLLATVILSSCGMFGTKDETLEPKQLVDLKNTLKVKRLWSNKVGGDTEFMLVGLRPAGDGSRIYVAGHDGDVVAFEPESGKQSWRSQLDMSLSAGPSASDGIVAVASTDGFVISIDASSGEELWRSFVGGEVLAQPLVGDESIVVQTIDNRLIALARFDGRQRWQLEQTTPVLSIRGASSPVMVGSLVVAGFDNGRLIGVNIDNGDVEWDSMLSLPSGRSDLDRLADVDGSIAVVGRDIYAAGYQGRVASIASESGQLLWSREISSYVGMAADWNSAYTSRENGEVIALNRSNGAELWRNDDLLRREPTLPVPFHTTVVVGDLEGYLHFLSNVDGTVVARLKQGGSAISIAPLVLANRLYVQGDDGSVAAYEVVLDRSTRVQPDIAETVDDDATVDDSSSGP